MNRINRVTSILIQLQSKKIIPAKEIAQRFNISLRTVYRDIRTLEEAGIPIGSEAGKGYFLVEGLMAALKALIIRKFTTRLPGEFIRMRCCLGPILFLLHLKNILLKQRLILRKS